MLAYNSSAVDPFTNTMVKSCTKDNVTVKHDPIDFGGQVQKTTATLAGDKGSYDILETYGYVIPTYAAEEKLQSRWTTCSPSTPTSTSSTTSARRCASG